MKQENTIEILECWKVTGRGMITELKYDGEGLPAGTILSSTKGGKTWKVQNRIIFAHIIDNQKRFQNELETFTHLSFSSLENLEKSKNTFLNKEHNNIYQYTLEPEGHDEKPAVGEKLVVGKHK